MRDPAPGMWSIARSAVRRAGRSPAPAPWWPEEDEVDEEVRADLDRWEAAGDVSFVGDDGAAAVPGRPDRSVAPGARLPGHPPRRLRPHEDAMLCDGRWLAHSLLYLGLPAPLDVVARAEQRSREAVADGAPLPLNSVEASSGKIMGWRDYIWHMYWHLGGDFRARNQ